MIPFCAVRAMLRTIVICSMALGGAPLAHAEQDITIAVGTPPTSLDPHFHAFAPNVALSEHIFEPLVKLDADSKPVSALAESWKLVDNLNWEIKLRHGVRFHDGSELSADDVLWSLERPSTIVGSPGSFTMFTRSIERATKIDAHTIRITTRTPYPLLVNDLSAIFIVSRRSAEGVKSEEFATGKGLVGTGPFKFVRFLRNDRIQFERNPDYWGNKPAWDKATIRFISNNATRMAALLSGDVQAIEDVPTADVSKLRDNANFSLFSKVSHRLIYVFVDTRDKTMYVTDANGKVYEHNPLKDARVRNALSMAIDRQAIRSQIMEGMSSPTNNLVPESFLGYNPAIKTMKYDPAAAKALLAQAGYPSGFFIKFHTPNNRYTNDEKIAQAIAQMWSKIGIQTVVEAQPAAVFFPQATGKRSYSAGLIGFAAGTGESSSIQRAIAACDDKEKGMGMFNAGSYCNAKVDQPLIKAMSTVQHANRRTLLQEAGAALIDDAGVIPVHHQMTTWAARRGIGLVPRSDEKTLAIDFRPQQ